MRATPELLKKLVDQKRLPREVLQQVRTQKREHPQKLVIVPVEQPNPLDVVTDPTALAVVAFPFALPSLNIQNGKSHWRHQKRAHDEVRDAVLDVLTKLPVPSIPSWPVRLSYVVWTPHARDSGNINHKAITDCLTKPNKRKPYGVSWLPDDRREFVRSVETQAEKGPERTMLRIESARAAGEAGGL